MINQNLEKALDRELNVLNEQIDLKIIRGLSYAREARRHKFILSRLSEIKRYSRLKFFGKSLSKFLVI